jgi:hypothetical protein
MLLPLVVYAADGVGSSHLQLQAALRVGRHLRHRLGQQRFGRCRKLTWFV